MGGLSRTKPSRGGGKPIIWSTRRRQWERHRSNAKKTCRPQARLPDTVVEGSNLRILSGEGGDVGDPKGNEVAVPGDAGPVGAKGKGRQSDGECKEKVGEKNVSRSSLWKNWGRVGGGFSWGAGWVAEGRGGLADKV